MFPCKNNLLACVAMRFPCRTIFASMPLEGWNARPDILFRSGRCAFYGCLAEEFMSDLIHHVSDATFEPEVLKSDTPVLVDYWAEWCGPCKAIAPVLAEIAKEYSGRLKVAKINVDDNQEVPRKYGIRGIPTLMLFKNGNVEAQKVGALSKSQLTAFLDSNI